MNDIFALAAQNTVVACVLALFAYGLTRAWRNPPVAHLLWLLVLVKLVAPPIIRVEWPAFGQPSATYAHDQETVATLPVEVREAESRPAFARPADRRASPASTTSAMERDVAADLQRFWARARPLLLWLWLGGSAVLAIVAVARIVRFERLLRDTLPASERLQRLAREVAGKLGIRRPPDVRYAECVDVPMLWCAGRPTIVLSVRLSGQSDEQHVGMILAHELAHFRRRDHWVRGFELIVSVIYWWNPLVWAVRRQIQYAEDLCCDAWVRCAFPGCTKHYAEVVFKAAESSIAPKIGARLLPASLFLSSLSLKARIEMILESRLAPSVSVGSMSVVALLALFVLPSFFQAARAEEAAKSEPAATAAPAGKPAATTGSEAPAKAPTGYPVPLLPPQKSGQSASEFPYVVKFQQGATKFLDGDKITILEVRGTAATFTPGNIYWIKGTYTLASHDRAMLAAFTTAKNAADGRSKYYQPQTTNVTKGSGTFTLFLPMLIEGWPHVSFYGDGEGFGGNYFGSGDSVLKEWWK